MVSAAGLAPAVSRFQAGHVAATLRAETPDEFLKNVGVEKRGAVNPGNGRRGKI